MTNERSFSLSLLPEEYSILKFPADEAIPAWAQIGDFFSITRTPEELSIVTSVANIPAELKTPSKWRMLKVQGNFGLDEVGVLASLAAPLRKAGISIFVISTYDTDYLLVNAEQCTPAITALNSAWHRVASDKPNS